MLRESIRKVMVVMLCVLSFSMMSCSQADPVFHDTDGKAVQLKKLRGKWVVVNYWASWCGGCIQEIPELNHFYKDHQNDDVVFLGVNFDQLPPEVLRDAIARTAITFPVLIGDPNPVWRLGEVDVLPTTFIINPKGRVVKQIVGPNTEASLQNELQALQAAG